MTPLLSKSFGSLASVSALALSAALVAACAVTQDKPAATPTAPAPQAQPATQPQSAAAPATPPQRATAPATQPNPAPTATQPSAASTTALAPAAATEPGEGLKIIDRKIGSGKEAATGKAAMVHYTGWLYDEKAPDKKGKQFDTSTKREGGIPFGFIVGVGRVIKGWDQGVAGMKVGGSRTLIVPASLAYGDRNVGNGLIPPNSTLIFDIDLLDVKP